MRGSAQVQKALECISRLEAENQRLQAENEHLNEKFVIWAYNAYVRGLGEKELNRSLPEIDRRQTQVVVAAKSSIASLRNEVRHAFKFSRSIFCFSFSRS